MGQNLSFSIKINFDAIALVGAIPQHLKCDILKKVSLILKYKLGMEFGVLVIGMV